MTGPIILNPSIVIILFKEYDKLTTKNKKQAVTFTFNHLIVIVT